MINTPLDVLSYTSQETTKNKNLIIFLRGIGGSHRRFQREGFVDKVRELGLPFDMVAPNSHFGYYADRTLVVRLKEDVIIPAQQQGYENIWLVGISMGGLGSLLYLREQPEDINGVFLISPFLGDKTFVKSIVAEGGVLDWTPSENDISEDWQAMLWEWIKTEVATGNTPPVYFGSGTEDNYVEGQRLLSEVLPADSTMWVEGGHNYPTFMALWEVFLGKYVLE